KEYNIPLIFIGNCYENGKGDFRRDAKEAIRHYLLAPKEHPIAQINVGRCYQQGIGTKKDLDEAKLCYEKAALQGDPNALYWFGIYYLRHEKKLELAIEFFSEAVKQGHVDAAKQVKALTAATIPYSKNSFGLHHAKRPTAKSPKNDDALTSSKKQ